MVLGPAGQKFETKKKKKKSHFSLDYLMYSQLDLHTTGGIHYYEFHHSSCTGVSWRRLKPPRN
jgi:hypothetical protein